MRRFRCARDAARRCASLGDRWLCASALPPRPPSPGAASAGAAAAGPPPQGLSPATPPPPPGLRLLPPSLFDELLLMAVPKRKVTPSRKGIRSTGKHLRFAPVVSRCPVCQRVKQPHAHCPHCPGGVAGAPGGGGGGGAEGSGGDSAP